MSAAPQSYEAAPAPQISQARAVSRFIAAALYFLVARVVAQRSATGLVSGDWSPLVDQVMLAFLLIVGYGAFGIVLERRSHPVAQEGLPLRRGWTSEFGVGVAVGWAIAVSCVAPMVLFGGIALHFSVSASAWGWLVADGAFFAAQTLAVQIAFRGYPFACATRAIGELPAVLAMATLYAILQAQLAGSRPASVCVSFALGLLLSVAYLRSRALWLPWGLHFGWIASRALLFGLPVEGVSSHSPVVQGGPAASSALTGGYFGLDGSWLALLVLIVAVPFVYRTTRDLSFRYNAPVLIPGGIPVDMDAAARNQHEMATRAEAPEVKPLVQIRPASAPLPQPVIPNNYPDSVSDEFSDSEAREQR